MKRFAKFGLPVMLVLWCLQSASAQFLLSPQSGDVYKEFPLVISGGSTWRVTDPNAPFNGNPPGNNPSDFLPNAVLTIPGVDISQATRAELVVDLWAGHIGTTPKQVHFKNPGADTSYITIPEITSAPDPVHGQCYMYQSNTTVAIPLNQLVTGNNLIQGNAGPQDGICGQNFGWGQWGWNGAILRVYYNPATKPHSTGSITSPTTGGSFGENPLITASTSGGVASVDFLGYYTSYDVDGDGRFTDWQHNYHRLAFENQMVIHGHIGTATSAPYQVNWNTDWVPDQTAGAIKFHARIRDNNGVYYVTPEVSNLSLNRGGFSVKMYTQNNLGGGFWIRNGSTIGATLHIPGSDNLANATAARMFITTWNGQDCDGGAHNTQINNSYTFPSYGGCNYWSYDVFDFPTSALLPSQNMITVFSASTHHGIEVNVPGPAVMVKYTSGPTITTHPTNQTVTAGQTAGFSVVAAGNPTLVYQWQKNNANISGATSANYTTPATVTDDNGASFRCIVSNAQGTITSNAAILTVNGGSAGPTVGGPWWNNSYHYRTQIAVAGGGFQRTNKVANFSLNFTTILTGLGVGGSFNPLSVRVIEVDGSGNVINPNVVFQFDQDPSFNASTNALGTVAFQMSGTTGASTTRYYHIYFDTGAGFTLPVFSNQLTLTDNVSYEGQLSYQINNQLGSLIYHKQGGGFASMKDLSNVEWIGYDDAAGSHGAGEYRGIPNMGNFAHPGYTNGSSTIISQGPIKVTIRTVTTDGNNAAWIWEFYPTYQTMTLQQTGANYWLLYEGTPNGTLDEANGFVKTSAPQTLNLGSTFAADLPSPEWAYFGTTGQPRFLYFAHHENDGQIDHYRPFYDVGEMTILGFGRDGSSVSKYLSQAPAHLTFGFGETESQSASTMDNAYKDLATSTGISEQNSTGPPTITQQPTNQNAFVGQTAAFTIGASGSSPLAYKWQKNSVDIVGATSANYTTPATVLGDNGATFRCIVSNSLGTVTSNSATLTVTNPPASFTSDDFSAATINSSLWTITNPAPTSTISLTGTGTSDALLSFVLPAGGSGHDVWTGGNFAPRLMQNTPNVDFTAEVKFQSTLSSAYQMQGIIVEQDANNYLRFDFLRTPSGLSTYSASFTGGNPTQRISAGVTGSNPMWLRVNRTGNTWTMSYSTNGTTFTTAGSFSHTLTVSKIGPFAGNAPGSSSPATTVLVDYFFNTASPITPEDPAGSPPAITQQPRDTTVQTGVTAFFSVTATGSPTLAYKWQKNNVDISGATSASYTTPAPTQPDSGSTFRCIISNAAGTITSNSAILNVVPPPPASTIVSDDFHVSPLNTGVWTFVNPAGGTQSITGAGTQDALLNIVVPAGASHDIYTSGYNAPRIMQNVNNTDFTVETKFQSTFTAAFQHEGMVAEQDANNVIRFDIYFDGANTNVFAASMIGGFGGPVQHINAGVGAGAQNTAYLRINRTGNVWTVSTSLNGTTFTQAGQFTLPFTLTKIGVWGGNSGSNPAFTMLCDYFFNNASPVVPEDPVAPAAPVITQQPTNQTVNEGQTAAFTVAATGSPSPNYQWQKNNVDIAGATNANYTTPATVFATDNAATFRCIVSNSQGTVTSNSALLTVNQSGPTITQQPRDTTVQAGVTAFFSVTATGSPTLTYKWQKNNVDIGGATSASYTTPATIAGDNGATFRCIVSNAAGTVTSNPATLTVNTQPAGTIVSDDFRTGTLNASLWTYINPNTPSTLSFTGVGTADALLSIALAAGGSGHDVWTGGNFAPRIMQNINNGDFQAEVKFQSALNAAYQMQGIIVEQDANNYLRFDFLRTPSGLSTYSASFTGGNPTQRISAGVTGSNPMWLRVNRTGNTWTMSYSTNGTTFTTAGSFSHTLTVSKIGPFAGNAPGASSPATTVLVDYFFNTAFPINPEDPVGPTAPAITQQPTNQTVPLGNTASFSVTATGTAPLAYQWQKNNADISGATSAGYTTPATTQPDSGSTFRCIVSNAGGTVTSNAAILHVTPPVVPSSIVSDDFHTGTLNASLWTFVNPTGGTQTITGGNTVDALLNIVVPAGTTHDIYTSGYNAPRIMQNANNTDFTVEAKFQSTFTAQYQHQGIVVEQDANNVIRFDIYFDGGNTNIFAASMIGGFGAPTIHVSAGVGAGPQNPTYLRINRTGNIWTVSTSLNGTTFTQAGQFTLPFTLTKIGVWAGNSGSNPAFTMLCDYFFNNASPIVPEDPTLPVPPSITQQPANQTVNEGQTAAFTVAATGSPSPNYQWQKNNVDIAGATSANYTTPATVFATDNGATFRCIVSNTSGTVTSNAAVLTVNQTGPIITQQPANQSVLVGATAAFSVTATGSPTLAYKWQKNNVDIGGATSANYTTPATVLGDNGATFRCIVSNSIGTVTSNSATLTVTTQPPGTILSDDFHVSPLNTGVWTFVNPAGGTQSITGAGTQDALLNIVVPAGASHDIYTSGYNAPRIMQNVNNTDFTVETKFQSTFTAAFQHEGMVAEQDANNVIRFDIYFDGANTNVFAASMIGGFGGPVQHINAGVGAGAQNTAYLRINRTGNVWTVSTSLNGTTFTQAGQFTLPFTLTKIGVWGGNSGSNPAFTMLCDYFFNNASPVVPEDPVAPAAPVITQQPTNQTVNEGQTAAFTVAATGSPSPNYQWQKNNVDIAGATNANYTTPATVFATDNAATFRCIVSNSQGTVTSNSALLTVNQSGPTITQQPRDTTVQAGVTAFFSVTATGSPTLTYKWQKNNVDIGGATSASYTTPATIAGDNGATFRCIVSNAAGTVTSNPATLTVNTQPAGTIVSDDFRTGTLNASLWTYINPNTPSTLSFTGVGTADALLSIALAAGGSGHDVWTGGNFAPRIMQNINNGDFQAEVKFQSALNAAYQMQGIIVEQDANNYLRFDFLRTPSGLSTYSASFTGGNPTQRISAGVTGSNPMWLRVNRTGNTWTMSYSTNGTTFTTAGSFSHTLTVSKIGPFAGNAPGASSPATTVLVDYFFNTAFPINPEDPVGPTAPAITQQPTNQTVPLGNTASFSVTATGTAPLAYQWQKNNADISGATSAGYTTPATTQPDSGSTFRCIVSNAGGTVTSNAAILHVTPPVVPSSIVSDDFHTGTLNASLWTFVNPTGGTQTITGGNTVDALLNIVVPAGTTHDIYTSGYNAPRIMQNANNTDFTVEAKFQSTFTAQYQHQGIVVEQDANNVIRFDIYFDGGNTNIFAASMIGGFGAPTIHVSAGVGAGPQNPTYLRINRTGNIWTVSTSLNGTTFTQAGQFTLPFTLTKIGVWAGNSGSNPAFTMLCDYFFNNASPIVPEDPTLPVPPSITQQPANQTVNEGQTAAFTVAATGSPSPNYQWQKNNVDIAGATSANYTTPATVFATDNGATFRCIVSNTSGTVTSNAAVLTVNQTGPIITQQPANQSVLVGATAAFSVTATGSPTLAYKWQKNNVDIGGATSANYTTPATVLGDNGATFRCIVSNSIGTVTSNSATLTVTTQPPGTILSDDFHVSPLNTGVWTFVNPAGGTQSITGAGTQDALLNIVVPAGASHDIYTSGYNAPRIMQNVNNTDFTVETKFQSTFTAAFQHEGMVAEQDANNVIRFDIYFDGANTNVFAASMIGGFGGPVQHINAGVGAGAQNTAYLRINRTGNVWTVSTSLNGTTFTQAGQFTLPFTLTKIGVWGGNSGSNPAFTMLCDYFFNNASPVVPEDPVAPAAPVITQQPTNQTVNEGQTAAFTVAATGSPSPNYQWQKNNVDIAGATNANYTTPATVFATDNAATFRCIVSNSQGTVTSNSALLTVNQSGPTITQQPRDTTVQAGVTAFFSVTATGSPTLTYKWQKNNVDIGGATSASYTTPATIAGDNGATFRCIVSNAAGTVTSNPATLTVNTQPAGTIVSDDFRTGTLNASLWTYINPNTPSTLSFTGVGTADALLSIALAAGGSGHDVWTGGNFAPRIMQNINNGDFQAEVKFQSALNAAYQMQGIIVEQDANNYLRFDFLRTPSGLSTYSASFTGGNPTQRISAGVTGSNPMWLRVNRTGNTWTMSYSTNGTTFTTAGSFSHTLTVSKIGPFAGNAPGASSPATTVLVDYFFNTAFPINPEDPVGPTAPAITQQPTNQTVPLGNTASFSVTATGTAPLAYQWQKNNADISGATSAGYTTPATTQPDSGSTFRCIVSNAGGTVTSNAAILHVTPPAVPSSIVSDDFHVSPLNTGVWTFVNPLADASQSITGATTSDALLNIVLPGGTTHDLWTNGYQVPRIMQNANNTDFTVEAKFQSTFTAQYQSEGIVIEQDANNVIRFDIYFDGVNTNIFAASFIGSFGTPTSHINTVIGAGARNPAYMRINRTGNVWTLSHSLNGTTFTQAGQFTLPFTLTKIGVWAGNSGSNPAFTMLSDYFFNNASPIVPEDPATPAAPAITQQPANQTVNEGLPATFTIAATGSPSPNYQWQKNNVDIAGATNANYTTPATVFATDNAATFRCIVSNTSGTVTSNAAVLTVNQVAPTITQHPINQSVQEGATAFFSVTSTGSPTLAYKWQKNNVDVGGATNASYTTPATIAGDNGATFRCIVSNAVGTVTSSSATLTVNSTPPGQPVSDDFSAAALNTALWTVTNPAPASTIGLTGTGTSNALLSIAIAAGSSHDVWTGGNFAPRIMQNINNVDFQTEVKFQSTLSSAYQMQGIIVEQDANNYLRFDFLRTPSGLFTYSASFTGGNPTQRINAGVTGSNPMWLRVNRTGNTWTMSYSTNGTTFTTAGSFSHTLTVSKIGPFAGNATGASSPATTVLIDYFFNTAFPINPEDPTGPPTAPNITSHPSDQAVDEGQTAAFTVTATGNPTPVYQWQKNSVNIAGATNSAYSTPPVVLADNGATFRCIVSNALGTVTSNAGILTVVPTGPGINVWYGLNQSFGTIGDPIPYVNILGDANDPQGIQSLRYILNGGSPVNIQYVSDGRRIDQNGDFNIEIPRTTLNTGANTVVITLTDNLNNVTNKTVTVNYSGGGNTWPQTYSINWNSVTNIQSVAQPADGLWALDTNGVRMIRAGYDRVLDIGEQSWTNYEVTFPFTVHSFSADGFGYPSNGPGIGVILRWNGNTDNPLPGANPKTGYLPLGAIGWYHWSTPSSGNMQILGNDANIAAQDNSGFIPTFGVRYMFKMKVHSSGPGQPPTYRMKIWPASQAEPGAWSLSHTGSASDPSSGTLGILAQECDANIGNITIVPAVSAARPLGEEELIALYKFNEGNGKIVHDISGTGTPLDLTIDNPKAATWTDNGLELNQPTSISSGTTANKIVDAVKVSNEITVEAWLKPTATTYSVPSRVIGFESKDNTLLEVMHRPGADRPSRLIEGSLHMSTRLENTLPESADSTANNQALMHLVLTCDASGERVLYVNGVEQARTKEAGNLTSWKNTLFVLGDKKNAWLGEYRQVAVYNRVLGESEVQQNFDAGPEAIVAKPFASNSALSAPDNNSTPMLTATQDVPKEFSLYQNYPNPFNPNTTIKFDLPKDENVTLTVYNLLGQEVATLVNERRSAGRYNLQWNAQGFTSGVYLYRIKAGDFVETRKLVLLK